MSRKRKRNSRHPGRPRRTEPYRGPILRSGRFIEVDGEELEFTLPRNVVTDDEWEQLLEEGWELDVRH